MHRTLIIGLGGRGAGWAKEVKGHPAFTLTGLADVDPDVLGKRGEELGVAPENRFTDYHEALASGQFDAVVEVTPTHLHYSITKDILDAGLHCLLEKPFTLNLNEAEELVELAESKKSVLQIVQNYRFNSLCQFIAEAIRNGRLGRLGSVEGRFHRSRPPRYEQEINMPHPMIWVQGIHHLDWLASILPAKIVQVHSCHSRPPWSQWQHPSICRILFECADGVLVSYAGSYNSQGDQSIRKIGCGASPTRVKTARSSSSPIPTRKPGTNGSSTPCTPPSPTEPNPPPPEKITSKRSNSC